MNSVVLMGRLTADPEVRTTQSGMTVCKYTLAVDRRFKKEGEATADFIRCTVFDKAADFCNKYFTKGMRICVSGRIQTGSYTKEDGTKVYTTDVIVDNQEFADAKTEERPSAPEDEFMEIPKEIQEELPFN